MEENKQPEQTTDADGLLLPEHKIFHSMGPKDCQWHDAKDLAFHVQFQRQTNTTGEMLAIQIPVFIHDTREEMMKRIQIAYSIAQERLVEENKAMINLARKAEERKLAEVASKSDLKMKEAEAKRLAKMIKKGQLKVAPSTEVSQ
jgi:hypothetical protein